MTIKKIKTLIVDDTALYRKIISDVLNEIPEIEVVGTSANGKLALTKIERYKPDLLILDIEMPELNGLEVLEEIKKSHSNIDAIMFSNFTKDGASMTIKALELGAFDFITKPEGKSINENKEKIKKDFIEKIRAYELSLQIKNALNNCSRAQSTTKEILKSETRKVKDSRENKSEIIAIGISTGGPNALKHMLPEFPENLSVPIVIVQHMPPLFTKQFAETLNKICKLNVKEAEHRETIKPGIVYIAPGGKQMKLITNENKKIKIKLTDDPPEHHCKPSVDYLFRSVAHLYAENATGVIMTGMGSDGTMGLKLMKRRGCFSIAQNEETCVVYGMPKSVIEAGIIDIVSPLSELSKEIVKTC